MGAAAITTTGFALNRARIAELLSFGAVRENSYGCIAAVDYITAPYSAVKLMMLHLGRLIQDLQFWSSFEVGQLHVPDGYVQISSIMPQKRNPVPIEHARLLASLAAGRAETAIMTMHNTPFTDMNDSEGEVQGASHAAFADAGRAIDLLAGLLRAARIDSTRVATNLDRSCATITELADTLVRREGLSFPPGARDRRPRRQDRRRRQNLARQRRLCAVLRRLPGHRRPRHQARRGRVRANSSRPSISSPCATASAGPAPTSLAAAIGRYRQRLAGFEAGSRVTAGREVAATRLPRRRIRQARRLRPQRGFQLWPMSNSTAW